MLQARFTMIRRPLRFWYVDTMKHIMMACVILHNIIVEDERELNFSNDNYDLNKSIHLTSTRRTRIRNIMEFIQVHQRI